MEIKAYSLMAMSDVMTGGHCTNEQIQLARRACLRQYEEGKISLEDLYEVIDILGLREGTRWYGSASTTPGTIEVEGKGLKAYTKEERRLL